MNASPVNSDVASNLLNSLDQIWPKDAPKADPRKDVEKLIGVVEEQLATAKTTLELVDHHPVPVSTALGDMPEEVLDGYVGEICSKHLSHFPISFALPAVLSFASVEVPPVEGIRTNLYTALIGPPGCGKSQAIEWAEKSLNVTSPKLLDLMAGSAEGLIRKVHDAEGNQRILSTDELGHLLEKAQIQGASFPYILNRAFYSDLFGVVMARAQSANFNARLSIIGGLTEEKFGDLFGNTTCGGLYDRFIFGAFPAGFRFRFKPFEKFSGRLNPKPVRIDPEVRDAAEGWMVECPELRETRVVELALRFAVICASWDGRPVLKACDLGPARQFADYQMQVRQVFRPNAGENYEGRCALKFLDYLKAAGGKWVSQREMLRACNANRFGPNVATRAIFGLRESGQIEAVQVERHGKTLLRLAPGEVFP
jgi:hypothetical protein